MAAPRDKLPCLDAELAAFVQGGVSVVAASRDRDNMPAIARACGCRVSADRRRVTLMVAASQAARLLDAIRATRSIAVVVSQPSSHRTIQLKGNDAVQEPLASGDHELIARYVTAFSKDIGALGHAPELGHALLWAEPADVVALSFSLSAAFNQTPGPRAGEPLGL